MKHKVYWVLEDLDHKEILREFTFDSKEEAKAYMDGVNFAAGEFSADSFYATMDKKDAK